MGIYSDKHGERTQINFYPSLDGGLNLSTPPENLNKNELRDAMNVEFSPLTGSLRVRGGLVWSGKFPEKVNRIIAVPGYHGFLAKASASDKLYYFLWNNIWNVIGTCTGNGEFYATMWDEPGQILLASGGKLQKFSGTSLPELTTITGSPEHCYLVFSRGGRVGVVCDEDTIKFSAVGDCTGWENDPNDDSTAQFIQIGYKDGMYINAVVPLSKDLIIFKSPPDEPEKGIIYRLTGDYPDWEILEVAHNTGTFAQNTVQAVGNDVFFITPSGLATLSNVTSYGEVKTSWPDRKVSSTLTFRLEKSAKLWHVPLKQQLWLLPSEYDDDIWILDYSRGIWSKIKFPVKPNFTADVDKLLFIFSGRDLYQVNDWFTHDEVKDVGIKDIDAKIQLGTILRGNQTLIKGAIATFNVVPECNAVLKLGNFKMRFKAGGTLDYVYDNEKCAFDDQDDLFPVGNTLTARRKFIVRDWAIVPEIKITGGGCELSSLGLEIVEV